MEDTNKELLIRFEGKLELFNQKVEMLAHSIDNFSSVLNEIEDKKLASIDRRIVKIEQWQSKLTGAWFVLMILGGLIGATVVAFINKIIK